MIYVSTGGSVLPFSRLVTKMDEIAGEINEEVYIQGGLEYNARYAKYSRYFPREKALELMKEARLVVSHAGAGTILDSINVSVPIIIVPRLKKFNEHFNDHQLDLAKVLEGRQGIKVVYDVDKLKEELNFTEIPVSSSKKINLINAIKSYLEDVFGN